MAARGARGASSSAVGMMEGAFFVSRTELLAWVNNLLQLNLSKVELCASGAVYCQILDSCSPGTVAMRKVNWLAKSDHEFIPNYKVLQAAFDKNNIEKHICVDQLIRAKYQDNLEFLQWMKFHHDRVRDVVRSGDYDAVLAREGRPLPAWAQAGAALPAAAAATGGAGRAQGGKENLRPAAADVEKRATSTAGDGAKARQFVPGVRSPRASQHGAAAPRLASGGAASAPLASRVGAHADVAALTAALEAAEAKVVAQAEELNDKQMTLEGLENERDYYFGKLRQVEVMCTTLKASMNPDMTSDKMVNDILGILYAEAEEEERDAIAA